MRGRYRRIPRRRSRKSGESWGVWCVKNRFKCQAFSILVVIVIGMLLLWWFCSTEIGGPLCSIMSGVWAAVKWIIGAIGSFFSAINPN